MNEKRVTRKVVLEGAKLFFKNFQGKQGDYNNAGDRNFCVAIGDELAEELSAEGWNVKYRKPLPDDPEQYRQPYLCVKVRFDPYPPVIMLITSKGKVPMDEETVDELDRIYMKNVDLIITPYNYPAKNGRPAGVSAYLKALYVTMQEDDLQIKYGDVPYANRVE